MRHPAEMGGPEVQAFLTWLAVEREVSASTHSQTLSALLFLYTKVLEHNLPSLTEMGHPTRRQRVPVVLSREEVGAIFKGLAGEHLLLARLLCGTGLRIAEGLQLRVKDLDFSHQALIVREGKGARATGGDAAAEPAG